MPKYTRLAKFLAAAHIFTNFCKNSKILSRLLSVLSLSQKFVHNHSCCPNSAFILTVSKMEAVLDFWRGCQNLSKIQWGGGRGVRGGGPLPAQAMRAQVASGYTAADIVLVISRRRFFTAYSVDVGDFLPHTE
jgi:hypothetical protein